MSESDFFIKISVKIWLNPSFGKTNRNIRSSLSSYGYNQSFNQLKTNSYEIQNKPQIIDFYKWRPKKS